MSNPITTRISGGWRLAIVLIGVPMIALFTWAVISPPEKSGFPSWVFLAILVFFVVGLPESLSRRFEFGPALIRYRILFRWHEVPVPAAVAFGNREGAISIRDANTGKEILEVTKEYTNGGTLLQELANYYLEHDREVVVL